jgi:hypothetical protein
MATKTTARDKWMFFNFEKLKQEISLSVYWTRNQYLKMSRKEEKLKIR